MCVVSRRVWTPPHTHSQRQKYIRPRVRVRCVCVGCVCALVRALYANFISDKKCSRVCAPLPQHHHHHRSRRCRRCRCRRRRRTHPREPKTLVHTNARTYATAAVSVCVSSAAVSLLLRSLTAQRFLDNFRCSRCFTYAQNIFNTIRTHSVVPRTHTHAHTNTHINAHTNTHTRTHTHSRSHIHFGSIAIKKRNN